MSEPTPAKVPSPADIQRAEHEGRLIESGWLLLHREVLASGNLTAEEARDYRRTFYAGAIHMLHTLRVTSADEAHKRLHMVRGEIDAFTAQTVAEITR